MYYISILCYSCEIQRCIILLRRKRSLSRTQNIFSSRLSIDVPRRRPEAAIVASFASIAVPCSTRNGRAVGLRRPRGGGEETTAEDTRWFGVGEKADRFFLDVGPFSLSSCVATIVHRSLLWSTLAARVFRRSHSSGCSLLLLFLVLKRGRKSYPVLEFPDRLCREEFFFTCQ